MLPLFGCAAVFGALFIDRRLQQKRGRDLVSAASAGHMFTSKAPPGQFGVYQAPALRGLSTQERARYDALRHVADSYLDAGTSVLVRFKYEGPAVSDALVETTDLRPLSGPDEGHVIELEAIQWQPQGRTATATVTTSWDVFPFRSGLTRQVHLIHQPDGSWKALSSQVTDRFGGDLPDLSQELLSDFTETLPGAPPARVELVDPWLGEPYYLVTWDSWNPVASAWPPQFPKEYGGRRVEIELDSWIDRL